MKYYVTAHGCVNDYGINSTEFVDKILSFSKDSSHSDGCLKKFHLYDRSILKRFFKLDISCQYLLESVNQVMQQVGKYPISTRIGVIVGTTTGPRDVQKRFLKSYKQTGEASSIIFKMTSNNIYSGIVALLYKIYGFNITVYTGHTASADIINLSLDLLKNNIIDKALVACVESCSTQLLPGAAAVMIELSDREHLNLEVISGKQVHLFTEDDIYIYLKKQIEKTNYDCIFCNNEIYEMLLNIKKDHEIICFDKKIKCFGSMDGLLQIIMSNQKDFQNGLLLSRHNERFSNIILKKDGKKNG